MYFSRTEYTVLTSKSGHYKVEASLQLALFKTASLYDAGPEYAVVVASKLSGSIPWISINVFLYL